MRPLLLLSIVAGGCFAEGPEGQNPTGDDDTTGTSGTSMTATASASTTTMDPVTTTPTSEATGMTDPTDTMTTDGPTTDETTTSADTGPDPDSSSTGEPAENVVLDFTLNPCDAADWYGDPTDPGTSNDTTPIVCPTNAESPSAASGWVYPATQEDSIDVEGGRSYTDDAIAIHPPEQSAAWAYGIWFVQDTLLATDELRGTVLCLADSECEVTVALGGSILGSGPASVAEWSVTFEDEVDITIALGDTTASVDAVTGYALMVSTGDGVANDAVVFVNPRIVRP